MFRFLRKVWALPLVALAMVLAASSNARATEPALELPDTGVDMPAIIDLLVAYMGQIVGLLVLAYAAFKVIKIAIRWFRLVGG